jgi:HSP20 family molecular chaperone IbpA
MSERVPIKKSESIFDELKKVEDVVTKRAYEIFSSNGDFGRDLDNWLTAERELIWKPAVELREKDNAFNVDVAVPGVDPKLLDVEVTPNELLVKAEIHRESTKEDKGEIRSTEFQSGNLFRTIAFPRRPTRIRLRRTSRMEC